MTKDQSLFDGMDKAAQFFKYVVEYDVDRVAQLRLPYSQQGDDLNSCLSHCNDVDKGIELHASKLETAAAQLLKFNAARVARLRLPYSQQGEDLNGCLSRCNDVGEAVELHASKLDTAATLLRRFKEETRHHQVLFVTEEHVLLVIGEQELIDSLISKEILREDPLDELFQRFLSDRHGESSDDAREEGR